MSILEDARRREILRTAGPVYQFCHARLQDLLADNVPSSGQPEAAASLTAPATGTSVPDIGQQRARAGLRRRALRPVVHGSAVAAALLAVTAVATLSRRKSTNIDAR